jgi:tagatose 1,6-diphosphate aldolase
VDIVDSSFQFLTVEPLSDGEIVVRLIDTIERNVMARTVATYRFEICIGKRAVGGVRFRAENGFDVPSIAGNLGFNVDLEFRGRRFAERACRLLLPLAMAHGFQSLLITCDPGNHASRRTCERLGAHLVDIVPVPRDSEMYADGERLKCRSRLELEGSRALP